MMTKRQHVLQLLRTAGPAGVTTGDLLAAGVGARYGARLLELRAEGYVIESQRVRDGSWCYRLIGPPHVSPLDVDQLQPALEGPDALAPAEPEPLFVLAPAPPLNASLHDAEAA